MDKTLALGTITSLHLFVSLPAAGVRGHHRFAEFYVQQQLYGRHESQAHSYHNDS